MEYKYNVYQIDDLENCDYAFRRYEIAKPRFDFSDYRHVYTGTVQSTGNIFQVLDKIFKILNIEHPDDYVGRSLSVSDIVEINDRYFFCDSFGWVEIKVD